MIKKDEQDHYEWPERLDRAVQRLRLALEEYREHSGTLKSLYDLLVELDGILEVRLFTRCRLLRGRVLWDM